MLLCFSVEVIAVAVAVCNPHTLRSSSPDDDDDDKWILYVHSVCVCSPRLSLLLLQAGQLPGLHALPPAVQSGMALPSL